MQLESQWCSDGSSAMVVQTPPRASAFVTDEVHDTASKDTEKRVGKDTEESNGYACADHMYKAAFGELTHDHVYGTADP